MTFHSLAMGGLRQAGYDNDMTQFDQIAGYPLERIHVPTLALHGTADTGLPVAHAELVEAKVPGARLIRAESGGHLFFGTYAHGDMSQTAMREFLASLA